MTSLKELFTSARSPSEDYPELIDEKYVPLLKTAVWIMLIGTVAFAAILLLQGMYQLWRMGAVVGIIAMGLSTLWLLRSVGILPAVRMLVFGSWLIITFNAIAGNGIRAPLLFSYPILLIFSGWLLGSRLCMRLFVVSAVALVGIGIAQDAGVIGMEPPLSAKLVAVVQLIILAISAVITLYQMSLYRRGYAEVRDLNDEIKRNLLMVEKRESDMRMLAEHVPGLVFEVDHAANCVFSNDGLTVFFGIAKNNIVGMPISEIVGPDAAKEFSACHERVMRGAVIEFTSRIRAGTGRWHMFDVTLVPKDGRDGQDVVGCYGLMYDVTKREQDAAELVRQATHDPLTGLANRLLLNDRLTHAMEHAARAQSELAVMMIDIDRFKSINDVLGHAAGDELLQEVAQRLKSLVRSADTIARLGGDEFVMIMMGGQSDESAQAVAAKILVELARPIELAAESLTVSASIGIAIFPLAGNTREELMQAADAAMYEAKAAGRNCFRLSSPAPSTRQ